MIAKHIEKGSKVHHDGYLTYKYIDWDKLGLEHYEHPHTIQGKTFLTRFKTQV